MDTFQITGQGRMFTSGLSTLDRKDIESAKEAKNRDEVGTIWDKLEDFFCGTSRVAALQLIHDMHNGSSNLEKVRAFGELKNLAAPAYQGRFYETLNEDRTNREFGVKLNNGEKITLFSVSVSPSQHEYVSLKNSLAESQDLDLRYIMKFIPKDDWNQLWARQALPALRNFESTPERRETAFGQLVAASGKNHNYFINESTGILENLVERYVIKFKGKTTVLFQNPPPNAPVVSQDQLLAQPLFPQPSAQERREKREKLAEWAYIERNAQF